MSDEIKQIGEMFKAKRKELNLSLKEVENSTSIRTGYLEAIEEGRKEKFLSPIYMIGFIRQYANFLGLEGDRIIQDHSEAFEVASLKHDFAYGIGTLEVRGALGGGVKWLPSLIYAAITVVVLVAAYFFAKYTGVF